MQVGPFAFGQIFESFLAEVISGKVDGGECGPFELHQLLDAILAEVLISCVTLLVRMSISSY
jgi:hypothetical protein